MNEKLTAQLPPYRIGHGFDVHRFGEGDHIVLGGVKIPHRSGFVAHSDGDVLIHALCDAMLGAIAAGDIGRHFPDTDQSYKNIDSSILLEQVDQLLKNDNYAIMNLDVTIIAQSPKMAPHIPAMSQKLADILGLAKSQINIKATTTEGLGFTGKEEGIAVHAVVMLYRMTA
jgi:2-C-methyl-D-erythritol 2,4-cyclodiphosphate synthase